MRWLKQSDHRSLFAAMFCYAPGTRHRWPSFGYPHAGSPAPVISTSFHPSINNATNPGCNFLRSRSCTNPGFNWNQLSTYRYKH